jgi:RecA-family ATPase
MKTRGTDRPTGETEPSAMRSPTPRVEGDYIAADIGDAADSAQIAVGKNISQTTVHTGGGANVEGDAIARDKIDVQGHSQPDWQAGTVNQPLGEQIINITQMVQPYRPPLQRPARANHFQDRREELARLLSDLQPGAVITISGPGGMGKTALAAQAVWQLAPEQEPPARFPDGIFFHSFYN